MKRFIEHFIRDFRKVRYYYVLLASIFVLATFRQTLPKPQMMGTILTFIFVLDMWIEYWMRTNRAQLPQRTCKVFLWIFNASILSFILMILAFRITPLAYWTPILRVYAYGTVLVLSGFKIFLAIFLGLHFWVSKFRFAHKIASAKRWFQMGLWMIGGVFVVLLYGAIYEVFDLRVHRIEVRDQSVPKAFDGYKIVHFSDMHIGSQVAERYVRKVVDSINAQSPDIVVFTGDMVNFHSGEILPFVSILSDIRAKDGVYVVLGNHDYGGYLKWKKQEDSLYNLQELLDVYQSLDWRVLQNEHAVLRRDGDSIILAGVENYSSKKSKRRQLLADTEKALLGTNTEDFVVMLSHNPEHFEEELLSDYPHVNLTLTGHSHGGQMALGVGKCTFSVSRLVLQYWRGFHQVGEQYVLVNTGCGFNTFPFRVNMPPNVSVITLKQSCEPHPSSTNKSKNQQITLRLRSATETNN